MELYEMSYFQIDKEIGSISRLKEKIWLVPRKEEVIPISEQERTLITKQLIEKLDWKERTKINLGICPPPEAPKTRKIVTGEPRSIYIFTIIEDTGKKDFFSGKNITNERYYEPFTKTEFKKAFVEEEGEDRIYGEKNSYLTIPDVDSKIWKKLPFIWYPGYSSDGIIDPSRDGDFDLIIDFRFGYWKERYKPDEKHYNISEEFERFRDEFNKLKKDELYQLKLKEYFEDLRRRSKQLQPLKPEVYRNPEVVLHDFLGKI